MISRIREKLKRDGIIGLTVAMLKYPFRLRRRYVYGQMLALNSPKERFSEIYKKNLWSSSESGSGGGSEIEYTEPLRKWLIENINLLNIKALVDAPCGDFNWMKLVLPKVDINYIGLDIVESVIEKNRVTYAADNINFEVSNICQDRLPDCDIIMVRDCLFHLSYEDINKFLINLSNTNFKYLFTTTHTVDKEFKNSNINTGDCRMIDLFSPPFSFDSTKIKSRVDDFPVGHPIKRQMILVEKNFVPTELVNF